MESQELLGKVLDPQRTVRLRDNKRRSRLRQKQYIADLEEKLRDLQREGVKATKEVQASARRVVQDNIRLRALLRYKGVDDDTVNAWTPEGMTHEQESPPREGCDLLEAVKPDDQNIPISNETLLLAQPAVHEIDTKCDERPSHNNPSESCQRSNKPRQSCPDTGSPEILSIPARPAPCKLISRLAEDPNTDITQILVADQETDQPAPIDGVECSKAYRMLMQFGTTEEKLDKISQALEEGCTANEGPYGGCRVRNTSIWRAIDDLS